MNGTWNGVLPALTALLLTACLPAVEATPGLDGGTSVPAELGATLNVRVEPDSLVFELHVTNATTAPVVAEFSTAQRHDFEVLTAEGRRVWRWSDAYGFAQVVGREELAPGESRQYRSAWSPGEQSGDYLVAGRLVSTNLPIEMRTPVHLPGR